MNLLGIWGGIMIFICGIIGWVDLHYGFLIVFLTAITAIILILYTTSTWKMSRSTSRSVRVAEESIRITKEKDRIDRTLDYVEKFENKRFRELVIKKLKDYPRENKKYNSKKDFVSIFPEAVKEIEYFLDFFDTLAILYYKQKIDPEIFEIKIEPFYLNFIGNFKTEITRKIKDLKSFDESIFYWYRNFIKLAVDVLRKKIDQDTTGWSVHFKGDLEDYANLLN